MAAKARVVTQPPLAGSASSRPTPRLRLAIRPYCANNRFGPKFEFDALPDTGATKTILAFDVAKTHKVHINKSGGQSIKAANSASMKCEGSARLKVTISGKSYLLHVLVSSDLKHELILSWHDLKLLGVIQPEFPAVVAAATTSQSSDLDDSLEKVKADFSDVFGSFGSTTLSPMKGEPMRIQLVDGPIYAKNVTTARAIPVHMKKEADAIVDQALKDGIIRPVSEPTLFTSPTFFVRDPPKEGRLGKVRMVTDYRQVNAYIRRAPHPFPPPADILKSLDHDAKFFCKVDLVKGYFQIPIAEDCQEYTTMLMPRGRFAYTRAPMGLSPSSDEFCIRTDPIVAGMDGCRKIVDDVLISAATEQLALKKLRVILQRCRDLGVTVSAPKLQLGEEMLFAGYVVSKDGIKPDPSKLEAIRRFETPTDVTTLRSYLGLVNQLTSLMPDVAHITEGLRELLKKDVAFTWLPCHQKCFDRSKELLTSPVVCKPFNPELPTELLTDASKLKGLGFALIQRNADESIHLVHCGSRSLSAAEKNYAVIELEMAAIYYAVVKCKYYLYSMPKKFTVLTDHRPLVGIFAKPLDALENARLRRYCERMQEYRFDVKWTPGKEHLIADALSRAPVFEPNDVEDNEGAFAAALTTDIPRVTLEDLQQAASVDDDYQQVIRAHQRAKLVKNLPPDHPAKLFNNVWDNVAFHEPSGLLLVGERVVVPTAARNSILELLHVPHCGLTKTKATAKQLYFWPGMMNAITQRIQRCEECQTLLPSQQREPLQTLDCPTTPMEIFCCDLFSNAGHDYLLAVDRFSGYPFVAKLRSTNTDAVTSILDGWFRTFGYPSRIRSDGGPQFRQPFEEFCRRRDIKHDPSSSYYPQSNGMAETTVRSVKHLLKKCDNFADFERRLAEWKNVSRFDGFSPAQMFFGRRLRGLLPVSPATTLTFDQQTAMQQRQQHAAREKQRFDSRAKPLQPFNIGDNVRLQDPKTKRWTGKGKVVAVHENGRSYSVDFDGRITSRNRQLLRPEKTIGRQQHQPTPHQQHQPPPHQTTASDATVNPPRRVQPPRVCKRGTTSQ